MLTLYHGRTSVCSIKVRLALVEKHTRFNSRLMTLRGDQFEPEYIRLNPAAVVPTVVHDDAFITESTVIMHYIDEAFAGPALMPSDPLARSKVRMIAKLIDEYVHLSCMTITFATANRASLATMSREELHSYLAKAPDANWGAIKRQVAADGLDAAPVVEALRIQEKLLDTIEAALQRGPFLAGDSWSLADAAATPYVWRLDKLKLARIWDKRPGVAQWYERVCARASFQTAVEKWVTPADLDRYAGSPDPWPKVRNLLKVAS